MRADRPLIVAIASLATGLGLIGGYCQGASSMNIAHPFSGSALYIDLASNGPAVLGGFALMAIGLLLLAWTALATIVSRFRLLEGWEDRMDSILDRNRGHSFEREKYPGSIRLTEQRHAR